MLNNNKQLIIFAAPSGSGKSSLIKKIIETSNNRAQLSVSATTRLPREGEIDGEDYFTNDPQSGKIYEVGEDGDPGDCIGWFESGIAFFS